MINLLGLENHGLTKARKLDRHFLRAKGFQI